jgi:hypothetical protein
MATIEVRPYTRASSVRGEIQEGDLVMFRDGPLHDRIIELGSGEYCHSALTYFDTDDAGEQRIHLVQATKERGVHTRLLSEQVGVFEGGVELWRVKSPFAQAYDVKKALDAAKSKIGLPYAMTPLYWFALDFLTFGLFDLRAKKIDPNAWFCSELVAWAAETGGVALDPKHAPPATSPSDLVTHERAECLGAFAHPDVVDRVTK